MRILRIGIRIIPAVVTKLVRSPGRAVGAPTNVSGTPPVRGSGSSITNFADERDVVELSFSLRDKGFHLGVAGVVGPKGTSLCFPRGRMSNDGEAKCGDDCALFAALKETAEQDTHPFPRLVPFPVTKTRFLVRDLGVECANLFTKISMGVCLVSKALLPRIDSVELLVDRIDLGLEGPALIEHIGECLLPGTEILQALPNVLDMVGERIERRNPMVQ